MKKLKFINDDEKSEVTSDVRISCHSPYRCSLDCKKRGRPQSVGRPTPPAPSPRVGHGGGGDPNGGGALEGHLPGGEVAVGGLEVEAEGGLLEAVAEEEGLVVDQRGLGSLWRMGNVVRFLFRNKAESSYIGVLIVYSIFCRTIIMHSI